MTAVLRMIAVALVYATMSTAFGAEYPDKPVRFIIPYPPGGNADLMARRVAQRLAEALGQPFVSDNRGGAGGAIGEELGARAVPDGYTIVLVSTGHVLNPAMKVKLRHDPLKALTAVSQLTSVPSVLVVHNSVAAKTVPEFIALAKSRPGVLNSAFSMGTTLHVAFEMLKSMAGVDIVGVNYRSGGLAIPDLEAGRVHMSFPVITTALTALKSGRVRALAITSAKRSAIMPDVPALAEFIPGYEAIGWQAIVTPTGTPQPVIDKLSGEIAKTMRSAEMRKHLAAMGADAVGSTPAEFERFRIAEYEKLAKIMGATKAN